MKFLITLFSMTLLSTVCLAQINATTNDGKHVLLKPDGTWEYIKEKSESLHTINTDTKCENVIETKMDKITGKSTTGMIETLIVSDDGGKTGFGIYQMKLTNTVVVSISVVGASSCIDDDGKMQILFRDGTRTELFNSGKFNCDGRFTLYFGGIFGKKKELGDLIKKDIETMRIWTSKSYVERNFTNEQSLIFKKGLECLSQ